MAPVNLVLLPFLGETDGVLVMTNNFFCQIQVTGSWSCYADYIIGQEVKGFVGFGSLLRTHKIYATTTCSGLCKLGHFVGCCYCVVSLACDAPAKLYFSVAAGSLERRYTRGV